jgi:hypothetical protein
MVLPALLTLSPPRTKVFEPSKFGIFYSNEHAWNPFTPVQYMLAVESPMSLGIVKLIVFGAAFRERVRLNVTRIDAGKLLVTCKLNAESILSIFPAITNPLKLKVPCSTLVV